MSFSTKNFVYSLVEIGVITSLCYYSFLSRSELCVTRTVYYAMSHPSWTITYFVDYGSEGLSLGLLDGFSVMQFDAQKGLSK